MTCCFLNLVRRFQSTLPYGSDPKGWVYRTRAEAISIHAPSRERHLASNIVAFSIKFQSTLPCGSDAMYKNFNPPPKIFQSSTKNISIHHQKYFNPPPKIFQSTLPCGSDYDDDFVKKAFAISIHAPLRERPLAIPRE